MANNSGVYDPDEGENQGKVKPRTHKTEHGVEVPDIGQLRPGSEKNDNDTKAHSGNQLRQAESGSSSATDSATNSREADQLASKADSSKDGLSDFRYNPKSKSNLRSNIRNRAGSLMKKKWLLGLGVAGGGVLIAIIAIILILIASLKIPDFAEHILDYQFVKVTGDFQRDAAAVTDEELALDTVGNPTEKTAIEDTYGGAATDGLYDDMESYSPQAVVDNYGTEGALTLNSSENSSGLDVLDSITTDGQIIGVGNTGASGISIPELKLSNGLSTSQDLDPLLGDALKTDAIGPIIHGEVATDMRETLGIGLEAWDVSKFSGDTPEQAELEQAREAASDIDEPSTEPATTGPLNTDIAEVDGAEKNTLASGASTEDAVANNGVSTALKQAVSNAIDSSGLETVLGIADPIYSTALPVCIVYDGSLSGSGSTITAQTNEEQRAFYYTESAADQQKAGDTTGEAVGAFNAKLGNIAQSNAEIRASGGTVDTSDSMEAEAAPDGQVSIADVLFPGVTSSLFDTIAKKACPALTDWRVAVGTGIANIFAGIFSGGTTVDEEELTAQAADKVLDEVADTIAEKTAASATAETTSKTSQLLTRIGVSTGEIAGATLLAKVIVLEHSNVLYDGLSENTDFDNEADAGGNLTANELERQQLYGRPLTNTEVAESNIDSQSEIAAQTRSESLYQRYFAVSNANSLITKVGTIVDSDLNQSFFSSILTNLGKIFNPLSIFSKVMTPLTNRVVLAQSTSDNSDYGNIQFGWSNDEVNLINSSSTYKPLENQLILTNSKEESAIAAKYDPCFGDSTTLGNLISTNKPIGDTGDDNYIVRDDSGNVEPDQGLCSPDNLSFDSPDSLAADNSPDSPQKNDMIFRWRLAMSYGSTLDQLTAEEGGSS